MPTVQRSPANGNPLLAAIYVRMSSKEQVEGYSLDAQCRACRDLCASRGYSVLVEYADEGLSAHTDNVIKRPDFARMLNDAEAGRFSVVVVHKMDRFARRLRTALECLERLGRPHVGVVSVSEPHRDSSARQGFLFLSTLGALVWKRRFGGGTAAYTSEPGDVTARARGSDIDQPQVAVKAQPFFAGPPQLLETR